MSSLKSWSAQFPGLFRILATIPQEGNPKRTDFYPLSTDVFNAFRYFEPEQTKVVILGQDPYHTEGKASGLAFGYHRNYRGRIDSSLASVIDEVIRTEGGSIERTIDLIEGFDISLESWAKQGVLLLNTRLTVEPGKPMSHAGLGWEPEIEHVLTTLCELPGPRVFMLWGAEARKTFPCLIRPSWGSKLVLETSHPCKFSAHRGFNGCNHFALANEWLASQGQETIKWI